MSNELTFKIRPSPRAARSDLKDAFRVYLTANALQSLKLRPGDLCQMKLEDSSPHTAIAWLATEKFNDTVVQTSKTLQDLYGLRLEDKVSIEKLQRPLPIASQVILWDVTENAGVLSEVEKIRWEVFLQLSLARIEVLAPALRIDSDFNGQKRRLKVGGLSSTSPQLVKVTEQTRYIVNSTKISDLPGGPFYVTSTGTGGLSKQLDQVNDVLQDFGPPNSEDKLPSYYQPIQGILLYGPKGTGKTLLIDKITNCAWKEVFRLTSENIRSISETCTKVGGPCLIIIANVDRVAPRSSTNSGISLSSLILELFDTIRRSQVLIVGETRHPNIIDEMLRAPGRFDMEVEVPVPPKADRSDILKAIRDSSDQPNDELIEDIAEETHGYVGADLFALLQAAVNIARKRRRNLRSRQKLEQPDADSGKSLDHIPEKLEGMHLSGDSTSNDVSEKSDGTVLNGSNIPDRPAKVSLFTIVVEDVTKALATIRPTAMQEVFIDTPSVRWSDIGGQHEIKRRLQLAVERPLKQADKMAWFNLEPTKGVLLYGPPGCSKTLLVKALATEAGVNFIAVKGAEVVSMYVGESERAVREIFRKARAASPSIIFFDEIDAIASTRNSELNVLTTLLNEMDGFEELKNVLVVAATNKPEAIDPALMRPGRFDDIVYVGLPDSQTRREIIQLWFAKSHVQANVEVLAQVTAGYSGAEIVKICQIAAGFAMDSEKRDQILQEDFDKALKELPRGVTDDVLSRYEEWQEKRGEGSGIGHFMRV